MRKSDKKKIRASFRLAVFTRDGYKCRVCGEAGNDETLDPHHITPREQMPNGGYVAANGITLCKKPGGCHEQAEAFLQRHQPLPGVDLLVVSLVGPGTLYRLIGSSYTQAVEAAERL